MFKNTWWFVTGHHTYFTGKEENCANITQETNGEISLNPQTNIKDFGRRILFFQSVTHTGPKTRDVYR